MPTAQIARIFLALLTSVLAVSACGGNKRASARSDAAALDGAADSAAGGAGGAGGGGGVAGSGGSGGSGGSLGSGGSGVAGQGGAGGTAGSAGGGGQGGQAGAPTIDAAVDPAPDGPLPDAPVADASTDATDATAATDATDATVATDATDATVATDATDAFSTDAGTCGGVRCPKLFALIEACRPSGACSRATAPGFPPNERLCYANGVKVRTMGNLATFPPSQTVSWTYPNGTPCYSVDLAPQIVGGGVNLTWKSPTDPLLARGTLDAMGNISITCEGVTAPLPEMCAPPASAAGCTAGTCD